MKLSSGIYAASEQRTARTKTTLIKLLLSHNFRSLCNTIHSNEQNVPITRYRRQITQGQNMLIHSVTTDLPLRMMSMMDDKAPKGCPNVDSSQFLKHDKKDT